MSSSSSRGLTYASYQRKMNDEYYTLYDDIQMHFEEILESDPDVFRDKVIYCPCDDFDKSNFPKYFMDNRKRLNYKKLICSCYTPPIF